MGIVLTVEAVPHPRGDAADGPDAGHGGRKRVAQRYLCLSVPLPAPSPVQRVIGMPPVWGALAPDHVEPCRYHVERGR